MSYLHLVAIVDYLATAVIERSGVDFDLNPKRLHVFLEETFLVVGESGYGESKRKNRLF